MFCPECNLKSKLKFKDDVEHIYDSKDYEVEKDVDGKRVYIDFTYHGLNDKQIAFACKTIDYMEEVLNSDEFKTRFLELDSRPYRSRKRNRFISKKEILADLLDGDFIGSKVENNSIDLIYSLYSTRRRNVVGYTTMSNGRIATNRLFFDRWVRHSDYASAGGHLFHELIHSDGYYHQGSKKRCIIYMAGYLMRDMIRERTA